MLVLSPALARCCSRVQSQEGGSIRRQVLKGEGRTKLNVAPDGQFYSFPRFVKHVDDNFLQNLTRLYEQRIPQGAEVLDLMSSWVSHLPSGAKYKRVIGHGLSAEELSKNKRLDAFIVKDLNQAAKAGGRILDELDDQSFDAVICAVSVQYLEQPERVFAEVFRLLRPGGVCIVSFSNRMFYDKAVAAWRDAASGYQRAQLVVEYFQCVSGFTQPEIITKVPGESQENEPLLSRLLSALGGSFKGNDPFYAVVAYRNFKPMVD